MKRLFCFIFFVLIGTLTFGASGRISPDLQKKVDSLIKVGLTSKAYPGAVVIIGTGDGIAYSKNYGYHDYSKTTPVTHEDVYDLASLTKVLSTTFVTMKLYDEGKIQLNQTIGQILPALKQTQLSGITVQELLTHTSGLRPQVFYPLLVQPAESTKLFSARRTADYPYQIERNLYMTKNIVYDSLYITQETSADYRTLCSNLYINPAFDTVIMREMCAKYDPVHKGRYSYNDSNFYLLQLIIEHISGKPLNQLTAELYREMNCSHIGFLPEEWTTPQHIVPTEEDMLLRRTLIHGHVHDELAAIQGGVCGNAGLFANADNVARFCEMLVNRGNFRGKQIISENTVNLFTSSPLKNRKIYRGLGFDKRSPETSDLGDNNWFGHTGFTGTFFWADKAKGIYVVFLSNRVHPTRSNTKINALETRTKIWQEVVKAY